MQLTATNADNIAPIDRVLPKLTRVKKCGSGWSACCPAHEDKHPSLTVAVGDDGKVLLSCKAGCSYQRIMETIGLRQSDGFPPDNPPRLQVQSRPRSIIRTYDYKDESGAVLFQCVRYAPKDFRQRHQNGNGEWAWNLDGCRRVLYRLPEIMAAEPHVAIWLVEGEKDADYLTGLGFVATTSPMGAASWRPEYAELLRGRHVIIVPDNDTAGYQYAAAVFESLKDITASCKTLFLPGLAEGGDVSDWLDGGHTAEDLAALADTAQATAEPPCRYTLHNASEVFGEIPPVEWVIGDLMTRGSVNVLCGPPGSKKTYTAIDMAVCVALGKPWLGRTVTQGPVLIVDEESGNNRLRRRLLAAMKAHGADETAPIYWTALEMFNFREKGELAHLDKLYAEVGPVLAIVDALADVMPGADENTVQDTHPVMQHIRALADLHHCANTVLHHSNKGGSYRGSTAIAGAVDLMLMVESPRENDEIKYSTAKVRDTEHQTFDARLVFGIADGTVKLERLMKASTVNKRPASEEYVLQYLREHGGEASLVDIRNNAAGCSASGAKFAVYRLTTEGMIARVDGGSAGEKAIYALTDRDRQVRMGMEGE